MYENVKRLAGASGARGPAPSKTNLVCPPDNRGQLCLRVSCCMLELKNVACKTCQGVMRTFTNYAMIVLTVGVVWG